MTLRFEFTPALRNMLLMAVVLAIGCARAPDAHWSPRELRQLRGLWIGSLPALPPDPSNRVADDARAAALGRRLFFDARLSANGQIACSGCHMPDKNFQDGRPLARGVGDAARRTMTIPGSARSPFLFWDGRADSQWAQALGPLENPVEHGADRMQLVHLVDAHYRADFETLFGPLPDFSDIRRFPPHAAPIPGSEKDRAWMGMTTDDRVVVNRTFANLGKVLAAFERTLLPSPSRFDAYVQMLSGDGSQKGTADFTSAEIAGLRLFIGKAKCVTCHNSPLLADHAFHNTGVPARLDRPLDVGRSRGAIEVITDPFNCLGMFSDAAPEQCRELHFILADDPTLVGAFRSATLRQVAFRAPYMHAGQIPTIKAVLQHYNQPPRAPAGANELKPLGLSSQELDDLETFLRTL
jgi:cytochrome c peroxidase